MGTFQASLRAIGDTRGVPATVELADGQLSITAGETEIGSWPLDAITLEPVPTGYRLAAEGDQILLEMKEVDSFEEALREGKKRRPRAQRPPKRAERGGRKSEKRPERRSRKTQTAVVEVAPPTPSGETASSGVLAKIDGFLESAEQRFGTRLPKWVFTRGMLLALLVLLVMLVVVPGLVSTMLLLTGVLLVLFGAIVYTDAMLAVRFLRGGMTPTKVLVLGVATLLAGVLVGTIAR